MLLNEFHDTGAKRFDKVNKKLNQLYGVKISTNVSLNDLYDELSSVMAENETLQMTRSHLHENPTYTKNLLLREGLSLLISEKEKEVYDKKFFLVLESLSKYAADCFRNNLDVSLDDIVEVYKETGHGVYNENVIKYALHEIISEGISEERWVDDDGESPYRETPTLTDRELADRLYKKEFGDETVADHDFYKKKARRVIKKDKPSMVKKFMSKLGR